MFNLHADGSIAHQLSQTSTSTTSGIAKGGGQGLMLALARQGLMSALARGGTRVNVSQSDLKKISAYRT